jgi:hypothetical protein
MPTLILALLVSASGWTTTLSKAMPAPITAAFLQTQDLASQSVVRNLFMFNYTYYANGFCGDQDCSAATVQAQMSAAQGKMGDDFGKYSQYQPIYAKAISALQSQLSAEDLGTLSMGRSYTQDMNYGAFVTCVDFAKVVMGRAIELGFPKENLMMYVTMVEDAYKKMCPATDGSKPILPRPTVHTMVAYKDGGEWYLLNVEDPEAMPIDLGAQLPARLGREHQFTFPALIAYQKLIFAGAYPADSFINGFPNNWLVSITADGQLETDLTALTCK